MIRAAFPLDRRRNASTIPATAVNAVRATTRSDQSCAPSRALVPPAETVRGSRCTRSGDSFSCRSGDPWFAAAARATPAEPAGTCSPSFGVTDSGSSGLASARSTVLSDDVIDGAVGSTAPRCTCGASATAGASAGVACSVATGASRATGAVAVAGVASLAAGALSACADSATTAGATSATGTEPAAGAATRGGSKVKGST
jgi:hypothetical protein